VSNNQTMHRQRVPGASLERFAAEIMRAHGVDPQQIASVAAVLTWSELIGRANFGLSRLPILMRRVSAGLIRCPCRPEFEDSAPAMQLLDGDAGFGHHIVALVMKRAIELAHSHGVGVVGVRNSNFFGAGAYFVNMAAEAGMLGLALSNSFPKVTAHGGVKPVMGTNPFAFAAPAAFGERALMLDMATAAGAGSTIREYIARGLPLPEGIAIDSKGDPITDPAKVASGTMLPFGGAKGYGLALMVEILCGVITGAGICHGVGSMYGDFARSGDNGHFMLAIDVTRFMPMAVFRERMNALVMGIRGSNEDQEVLLPGEIRWRNHDENLEHGIPVEPDSMDVLDKLAEPYGIVPPWQQRRGKASSGT